MATSADMPGFRLALGGSASTVTMVSNSFTALGIHGRPLSASVATLWTVPVSSLLG